MLRLTLMLWWSKVVSVSWVPRDSGVTFWWTAVYLGQKWPSSALFPLWVWTSLLQPFPAFSKTYQLTWAGKQHWLLVRLWVPPWLAYLRSWIYDRLCSFLSFSVFFFLQLVSKSMQQFWVNIFWEWKESEIKTFLEYNMIVFFYLKLTKQLSLLMASYLLSYCFSKYLWANTSRQVLSQPWFFRRESSNL